MIVLLILLCMDFTASSHIKLDSWTNTSSDMENYRNVLENHYIQHSQTTIQDPNFETENKNM